MGSAMYGIYPLRGKIPNVMRSTTSRNKDNKQIEGIKKCLGLKSGVEYKDFSSLRYGRLMILTDQVITIHNWLDKLIV